MGSGSSHGCSDPAAVSSRSRTTTDHLIELFDLVGAERFELTFGGENGAVWLEPHFDRVERRDAEGTVTLRDAELIRSYLRSSERLAPYAERVPELVEPLVARRRQAVFVAEKTP